MANKLISLLSIPAFLFSCNNSKNIDIKGSSYEISKDKIIQTSSSFLEDSLIKIGLVSDVEGAIGNAKSSAEKLKRVSVDAVIIAGDCYENENLRRNPSYPNSTNNSKEMFEGIKPYAELGVPVFVVSGNHETKEIYEKSIEKLKEFYPNVFDINDKSVDLKGLNIVGMGGYHDSRFISQNGFLLDDKNYDKAKESLENFQEQKEPSIFVTHGPPKSNSKIDYVYDVGHVGDNKISKILNNKNLENVVNIHGHIHEGGRNGTKYNSNVAINVASITDYNNSKGANTSELIFGGDKMKYKELK
jgi:Icc-related predicted phosphoesterase